jgi:aspartyl-tRNA(Asn)/glutamyl-tRNA(Gln) amidotransferase subunit A
MLNGFIHFLQREVRIKMSRDHFLTWSIDQVSRAIKNKEISALELTKLTLQSIEEEDHKYHSMIILMHEQALLRAAQIDQEMEEGHYRGPLMGIPIALKDNVFTKGIHTYAGSELFNDFIPDYDAEVVKKLEHAGAIIIGKANMHEYAYGTTGDRCYGGPVMNPRVPNGITGGSSSGSGASVAANFVFGAIGSDTGGSIRIPAAACGIVGMKPTFGRVSKFGVFPMAQTLDHLGPMTRTVRDNALMLNAIAGYDPKDSNSVHAPDEDFTRDIGKSIHGRTIGIPTNYYFDSIQPEVMKSFSAAVERLVEHGVIVKYIEIPHMNDLYDAHQTILAAEAYSLLEQKLKETPDIFNEESIGKLLRGKDVLASEYLSMLRVRQSSKQRFEQIFTDIDVIMTPTLSALPTTINQRQLEINGKMYHTKIFARLTGPANTLGFPAISVPGESVNDIPVGIQLIGLPMSEHQLYQFAYVIEQFNSAND